MDVLLHCAGCTDPSAANYNPSATQDDGTCTFVVKEAGQEQELSGDLHTFITTGLSSLWGESPMPILKPALQVDYLSYQLYSQSTCSHFFASDASDANNWVWTA